MPSMSIPSSALARLLYLLGSHSDFQPLNTKAMNDAVLSDFANSSMVYGKLLLSQAGRPSPFDQSLLCHACTDASATLAPVIQVSCILRLVTLVK